MEEVYRRTKTTVSLINYHFVFCPRCRRKIFDIPGVEDRFKQLVAEKCELLGIEILAMECHRDHAHLFVNCSPKQSPSFVMSQIKGYTGRIIRREFSRLSKTPNLWTRSYFVSTAGDVSTETIRRYVEAQKTKS